MIGIVLRIAIPLIVIPVVLLQVRRPSRWIGRLFLWQMNGTHSGLTDWGLTHAPIEKSFIILDVGCGGGRTIEKLATRADEGRVFGVDYSAESVDTSRAHNARLIQAGRVEVRRASVSQLPYPDATFDLVTAVETHYYWPDLPGDLREVKRTLKPGAELVVIAESYKQGALAPIIGLVMMLIRAKYLTAEEHRALLVNVGFSDVQVHEDRGRGWICVTGRRPASEPATIPPRS